MGSVASVLRVLGDFGEAAGWLIAAFVLFACGRRILRENEAAHAAIIEDVQENRKRIDENRRRIDDLGGDGSRHRPRCRRSARPVRPGRRVSRRPRAGVGDRKTWRPGMSAATASISSRIRSIASQKRSSSSSGSLSVGSTMSVPGTGSDTVGAWNVGCAGVRRNPEGLASSRSPCRPPRRAGRPGLVAVPDQRALEPRAPGHRGTDPCQPRERGAPRARRSRTLWESGPESTSALRGPRSEARPKPGKRAPARDPIGLPDSARSA